MKIEITYNMETKKVSFTKPQANIVERILNGETIRRIGDEYYWPNQDRVFLRPLCGAIWAINSAFNTDGGRTFFNI